MAQWQTLNGDPMVYVGEFGVYAPHAPTVARLAWIKAAREGFEQRNWGWALWDYSADFGFLTDGTRPRKMDVDAEGAGSSNLLRESKRGRDRDMDLNGIEKLIADMTLVEKLGQMTMSPGGASGDGTGSWRGDDRTPSRWRGRISPAEHLGT